MALMQTLKAIAQQLKGEFVFYQRLQRHPKTPWFAKAMLWLAIGYLLLPFDLIPDFLPIIGQLDDVIIIPFLLYLAVKCTPQSVLRECRQADADQ
jgi:uncharacterized membrane protein YkvA (DUF1232 family)